MTVSLSKGGMYVIRSENTDGSPKTSVYVGQESPSSTASRHRDEVNITRTGATAGFCAQHGPKWASRNGAAQNAASQILSGRLRVLACLTRLLGCQPSLVIAQPTSRSPVC